MTSSVLSGHLGLGYIVRPVNAMDAIIERWLSNPERSHVYVDIARDEVNDMAPS